MKRTLLSSALFFIRSLAAVIAMLPVILMPVVASAQLRSSATYQLERDDLNSGGGYSTSANYVLEDTIGGSVQAGTASSANYSSPNLGYQQVDSVVSSGGGGGSFIGFISSQSCSISFTSDVITSGETTTMLWSGVNTGSGVIDNGVGVVDPAGTVTIAPLTTTTYTGTFDGLTGDVVCRGTITVNSDADATGFVRFISTSVVGLESLGQMIIQVERFGGTNGQASVTLQTNDGSALGSSDYTPVTTTVSWADGEDGVKNVIIPIINDGVIENSETLSIEMFNPVGAAIGGDTLATGMIIDAGAAEIPTEPTPTDAEPTATVTIIKDIVNNFGGAATPQDFSFEVGTTTTDSGTTITVPADEPIAITESGPSGYEFLGISGSVSCPNTLGESIVLDAGEAITCTVLSTDTEEVATIDPNQAETSVQFQSSSYSVEEQSGEVDVVITRSGSPEGDVSATIEVIAGTADDGDYIVESITVFWEDGEIEPKTVSIPLIVDDVAEPTETFQLRIVDAKGAVLGVTNLQTQIQIFDITPTCEGGECEPVEPPFLPKVAAMVEQFLGTPEGKATTAGLTVAGLIAGVATAATLPFLVAERALASVRMFGTIISLVGFARRQMWGVVYDKKTKRPLDPAYVSLRDMNGDEVLGTITDIEGRYGFMVDPGIYHMECFKTGYRFHPTNPTTVRVKDQDKPFSEKLYLGEAIQVKRRGELVFYDIAMDPLPDQERAFNEIEKEKRFLDGGKVRRSRKIFRTLAKIFYTLGFAFAIVAFLFFPSPLNFIVFGIYILLYILHLLGFTASRPGKIVRKNGSVTGLRVVVVQTATELEVSRKTVADSGHYFALVTPGEYYVRIDEKDQSGAYQEIHRTNPFPAKRGYINRKIRF